MGMHDTRTFYTSLSVADFSRLSVFGEYFFPIQLVSVNSSNLSRSRSCFYYTLYIYALYVYVAEYMCMNGLEGLEGLGGILVKNSLRMFTTFCG